MPSAATTTSTIDQPSPQELLRALLPAPAGLPIGTDAVTKRPIRLPLEALKRNIALEGEIGQGKTTIAQELCFSFPFSGLSTISLDYIGTGFDWAKRFVATTATILLCLEHLYPDFFDGITRWFLERHAFAVISSHESSDIRIDMLKRRVHPDGQLERVGEIVDRALGVFSLRFEDLSMRVRFRRVGSAVLACLSAAGRSISEYRPLLEDALFRGFVFHEIERLRANDDEYVREQMRELERICILKPREFKDETDSTFNALADYAPGTVLGSFFGSDETFDPCSAIFGDRRFFVTTDLSNQLLRKEALLTLHAINTSHFALRRQGTGRFNRTFYVLDEVVQWAKEDLTTLLATGRNLKVSTVLAFQNAEQWAQAGFPHFPGTLPSVCRLRGVWRPTSMKDATDLAFRTADFDPMGMLYLRHLTSVANGTSVTDTMTDTWSSTISRAKGTSAQGTESTGGSESAGESTDKDGKPTGMNRGHGANRTTTRGGGSSSTDTSGSTTGGSRAHAVGTSVSETVAETIFRIPIEEQLKIHAKNLMSQREHRSTWLYEGKSVTVDNYPPRNYPAVIGGVPILEKYNDWHAEFYAGRADRRAPFSRDIVLAAISTPAALPPASASNATTAIASAPLAPVVRIARIDVLPPLPLEGATKTVALLQLAATIRLLTVNHVIALTGWSYDKTYRELDRCAQTTPPLLERIRPFAAKGKGSAPVVYILGTAGAQLLAAHGGDSSALQRIVRNGAAHRRAVDEGTATQHSHRRYAATLLAFAATAVQAAGGTLEEIRADRECSIAIDFAPYIAAMSERDRAALCPNPAKPENRYLPDLAFTVVTGDGARTAYFVEIETGRGERDRDYARQKAWKLRAVADVVGGAMPAVLVWLKSSAQEERFIEEARPILGPLASRVYTTSGDILPLTTPPGVNKRERAETVRALGARIASDVWRRVDATTRAKVFA